jgi:hypothetical protein
MLYASLSNIAQLKERWRTLSDLGIYVYTSAGVAGLQCIHTGNWDLPGRPFRRHRVKPTIGKGTTFSRAVNADSMEPRLQPLKLDPS